MAEATSRVGTWLPKTRANSPTAKSRSGAQGSLRLPGRLLAGAGQIEKGRQQRPFLDDAGLHHLRNHQVLQGRFAVDAGVEIGEGAVGRAKIDADDVTRKRHCYST